MSVCIVAQFPWHAILGVTEAEPPGAIVCSDTGISSAGQQASPFLCSKQEPIGKNIVVCYTSSNAAATILGLKKVRNHWNVKRIGESLRDVHRKKGGTAEVIAVVSRKGQAPQILELMPPRYIPHPRRGVVGIGDRAVLDWFRGNFVEDPTPELEAQRLPPEAVEGLAHFMGHPVEFPPITYPLEQAALSLTAAFTEGIRISGGPTVSLPVQVMTISGGEPRALGVTTTADLENWEDVTADRADVRIPRPVPPVMQPDDTKRSAVQLFK